MASRSFHALFLRARDQYAGSARWLYLVTFVFALAHAGVVTPFVERSLDAAATESERGRLAAVERGLGELEGALQAARDGASAIVSPLLDRLVEDLEHDLERLDATREKYAATGAEPQESAGEATGGDPDPAGASAAEAVADAVEDEREAGPKAEPFDLEDPDWIADLRDAETRDDLLAALAPVAEELIVRRRFFDLEQSLETDARPRLLARLDSAAAAVPGLRGALPEARAQWEALSGALGAWSRAVRELRFEPPPAPFWWSLRNFGDGETSGGGEASGEPGEEIEIGLAPALAERIRRPPARVELEDAADRALEGYRQLVAEVTRARQRLGEPVGAGTLGGLDLSALAAFFPLLLGLALAGAVVWRSGRLKELGSSTALAIEHGGPAALRRWLFCHVQWRTAAGRSAASAWRSSALQTLTGYFLGMGWIALAAAQLRQLDSVDRHRLLVFTLAGAAAVLLAVVHRLGVARQAILGLDAVGLEAVGLGAVSRTAEPEDAEPEDVEPEDVEPAGIDPWNASSATAGETPASAGAGELIDVRPLKR